MSIHGLRSNYQDFSSIAKTDSFMYRPIHWIRESGTCACLRKILAVVVAVLLSVTLVGLVIVIPGIKEYRRQDKPVLLKDTITQELMRFNNGQVKGQVHGIYITTNESGLESTAQKLKDHPRPSQTTVHIGCAAWHNLDIMYARGSDYGLIIDFNPKNAEFMKKTMELVKHSESRALFVQNMVAYLNGLQGEERQLFFHKDQTGLPTERIEKELMRDSSWLGSDDNYRFIRQLAFSDRLVALTENITHSETFSQMRAYLDKSGIVVDTVYLSNICQFMRTSADEVAYQKTVGYLLNKETLLISCPKSETGKTNLKQSVFLERAKAALPINSL